jgi:hypothetical protein
MLTTGHAHPYIHHVRDSPVMKQRYVRYLAWKQEDYACFPHHSHLYTSQTTQFAEQDANPEVYSMAQYSLDLVVSY